MKHLFSPGLHVLFSFAASHLVVFHSHVGVPFQAASGQGRMPCGRGQNLAVPPPSPPIPPAASLLGHVPQSVLHVVQVSFPLQVLSPQLGCGGQAPQSVAQVEQVSPISAMHHASPQ